MSSKSLYLKRTLRPLAGKAPVALLTLTIMLSGSIGLAGNAQDPEALTALTAPMLESRDLYSESGAFEPRAGTTSATPASGPDTDVLNMAGDWIIKFGGIGRRLDSTAHYVPVEPLWPDLQIHLYITGPGEFGGQKFEGYYTAFPWLGTIKGETFYDGWGVQLVQMRYEEPDRGSGRYYKLLSGKHERYGHDPTRVEVFGGWVEVGSPGADAGAAGNFVMTKL